MYKDSNKGQCQVKSNISVNYNNSRQYVHYLDNCYFIYFMAGFILWLQWNRKRSQLSEMLRHYRNYISTMKSAYRPSSVHSFRLAFKTKPTNVKGSSKCQGSHQLKKTLKIIVGEAFFITLVFSWVPTCDMYSLLVLSGLVNSMSGTLGSQLTYFTLTILFENRSFYFRCHIPQSVKWCLAI